MEIGIVSGPNGPTRNGCVCLTTTANHRERVEKHDTNMHSMHVWSKLTRKILLLQISGREEWQCRWTIPEYVIGFFWKVPLVFLRNSLFSV